MLILGIDPSGNHTEGKGTTGLCLYDNTKQMVLDSSEISAKLFAIPESYWNAHIVYLSGMFLAHPELIVSMEDYLLYGSKANAQTNSRMETSQLIGCIKLWMWQNNPGRLYMRPASVAKTRWTNKVLEHKGLIYKDGVSWYNNLHQRLVTHTLDAMRHAVHTGTFEVKENNDVR